VEAVAQARLAEAALGRSEATIQEIQEETVARALLEQPEVPDPHPQA
jgi:hypothetical protein